MAEKNKQTCTYKLRKNTVMITAFVVIVLFILDVIFQGEVYKRLPVAWQNKLSEWVGRQ